MTRMAYSPKGIQLTKNSEMCKLAAYLDSGGVPTIGYGHTHNVRMGDTCTQDQADQWLLEDVQTAVNAVNHYVAVQLTQPEFDAIVDFVYNVGQGNFSSSTMLRKLNAGDFAGAAKEFLRWDMAGGIHIAGLLNRRKKEEDEFNSKPV